MDLIPKKIINILPKLGNNRGDDPEIFGAFVIPPVTDFGRISLNNPYQDPSENYVWFILEGEETSDGLNLFVYDVLEQKFEERELSYFSNLIIEQNRKVQYRECEYPTTLFRAKIDDYLFNTLRYRLLISVREANVICTLAGVKSIDERDILYWKDANDLWRILQMNSPLNQDKEGMGVLVHSLIVHIFYQLHYENKHKMGGSHYYYSEALAIRDKIFLDNNKKIEY